MRLLLKLDRYIRTTGRRTGMRIIDDRKVNFCTVRSKQFPNGRPGIVCRERLFLRGPSFAKDRHEEAVRQCTEQEVVSGQLCILLEEQEGEAYTLYIPEVPCGGQCHEQASQDRRAIEIKGDSYRCFATYPRELQERAREHYQISLDSDQNVLLLIGHDGSHTIWRGEPCASAASITASLGMSSPQAWSKVPNETLAEIAAPKLAVP